MRNIDKSAELEPLIRTWQRGGEGKHFTAMKRQEAVWVHFPPNWIRAFLKRSKAGRFGRYIASIEAIESVLNGQNTPPAEKYVCLMNPPIKNIEQMRRQSSLSAAWCLLK